MKHLFGQEWDIIPAGGATGEAFFATNDNEKLFLKRNSSPFLAVLSAEGIVPKLIWTKRMENGDVITAQQCVNGREFKPKDMAEERAATLLKKIHESLPLLKMLKRMGKAPTFPAHMLEDVNSSLDDELKSKIVVQSSLDFLEKEIGNITCDEWAVCHGDVNHNNWLLTDTDDLYLIDWDGATIADPALDLGLLLYWYIPRNEWARWLAMYGRELSENLEIRMKWYVIAHTLTSIQWHKDKERFEEMQHWLDYLTKIEINFSV
ncbi:phosphotransferase family protein [Lederbergia lenta]|uniref:Phosphotransferase n=1 Tax=Lederbergia lenta TaxID=1467 RepID=A0A2X4ZL83_LEDLE|nr:phosphotransferase family protein [Lederbergia lenta]MCM3113386.1 phosphotransferase family protein [Lederbergia lenta]MEC2326469.1 phosphotransferase family protein [Lederbergia lenta]SQI61214.1 phosphotransferase [Lederbergia lenta]